jgi:hypothetical protein
MKGWIKPGVVSIGLGRSVCHGKASLRELHHAKPCEMIKR